jgi:hypothetical protein
MAGRRCFHIRIFSFKALREKAKWKTLDSKTRKTTVSLFIAGLCSFLCALGCLTAIRYEAPHIEVFRAAGYSAVLVWVALTALAFMSNIVGSVASGIGRYQRMPLQRCVRVKTLLFSRLPVSRVTSRRAGHARAHHSASRSAASSDASKDGDDGGSDSDGSDGDPPVSPSFAVPPFLSFPNSFYEPHNFLIPWRFLCDPGCRRMLFDPLFTERGWTE